MRSLIILTAALLSACASTPPLTSVTPPACPAEAMQRCEPALTDPPGATMAQTEATDATNRARWLRCVARDRAKHACLCALENAEVTGRSGMCEGYLARSKK